MYWEFKIILLKISTSFTVLNYGSTSGIQVVYNCEICVFKFVAIKTAIQFGST